MAPKKLTECPENLREAIDWLIQVRHGSGPGDKGFDELAKALKKLIEEAIKEANTSFQKRENELNCGHIPNNNNCCDELKGKIEEAKTSSNSSKLLMAESALKKHLDEDHYLSKDARQRSLDDIKKRRDSLGELETKLEPFIGKKEDNVPNRIPAKSILDNLCSGLENFLGFNSETKGYTGTGIVYSDLDRLCDGVMAFLLGVLESVKDDESVQRYDTYITDPGKNLKSVINDLQVSIGHGSKNFGAHVTAVGGWVGRYYDEVRNKLLTFKRPLDHLLLTEINGISFDVTKMHNNPIHRQHDYWSKATTVFTRRVKKSLEAFKLLDKGLQNKLEVPMKLIDQAVKMFVMEANNTELQGLNTTAEGELNRLEYSVKDKIHMRVGKLTSNLQMEFQNDIQTKTNDIESALKNVENDLNDWTAAAEKVVEISLSQAERILERVKDSHYKNSASKMTKITKQATTLRDKAIRLRIAAETAKETVERLVNVATVKVADLDKFLRYELNNVKGQIETHIGKYVKNELLNDIKVKVEKIINGHRGNGLRQVVQKVQGYVETYGMNFQETLGKWVTEILKEKDPVKSWLEKYIRQCQTCFDITFNDDQVDGTIKKLVPVIVKQLKERISYSSGSTSANVADDLKKIEEYLHAVAKAVIPSNVQPVVSSVEGDIIPLQHKERYAQVASHHRNYLHRAFESLFPVLSSMATQAGEEINNLISNCQLENINTAISVATPLDGDLQMATTTIVGPPPTQPYNVNGKIKEILDDQIGKTGTGLNISSIESLAKLTTYSSAKGTTGSKEALDTALIEIRNKGLATLAIDLPIIVKQTFETPFLQIDQELKELTSLVESMGSFVGSEKGVKTLLNELNDMLGDGATKHYGLRSGLWKIHNNLHDIVHGEKNSKSLKELIIAADKFHNTTISKAAKQVIQEINQHLETEFEKTSETIRQRAQQLYASRKQKELEALHQTLLEHKYTIDDIMEEDKMKGTKGLLMLLKDNLDYVKTSAGFKDLATTFKEFADMIIVYITGQVTAHSTAITPSNARVLDNEHEYSLKVANVRGEVDILLTELNKSGHFDYKFSKNLDALRNTLVEFNPPVFTGPCDIILHVVKFAVTSFTNELGHAYINAYSGGTIPLRKIDKQNYLTADATKSAEVFLTIIPIIQRELTRVRRKCLSDPWKSNKLYVTGEGSMGLYLTEQGYSVPSEESKQHGELKRNLNGRNVFVLLHIGNEDEKLFGDEPGENEYKSKMLSGLYDNLSKYYTVCHHRLPPAKRYPCSIRDMLSWMSGLPYTSVYDAVQSYCQKLLESDKTYNKESVIGPMLQYNLFRNVNSTAKMAYSLLVAICGHGHGARNADYPYACNLVDNSRGLHYPSDVPSLSEMLTDICRRLLYSLHFLYSLCRTSDIYNGWGDCQYGRNVPSYQWHCEKSYDEANCQQKSPLQTYLMDGLPSFVPHVLTSVGCRSICATCTIGSTKQQCITPMGFWDLTSAGSIVGSGKDICDILANFCGNPDSPLPALFRCLMCIQPYPPRTLSEMFSFYSHFMQRWSNSTYTHNGDYRNIIESVIIGSFPLIEALHGDYPASHITNALEDLYNSPRDHSGPQTDDNHCDLASLHTHIHSNPPLSCKYGLRCAPYLQPLGYDAYHTYPAKHATLYLSWAVYLAWDFWELLIDLLNSFERISCKLSNCVYCDCASKRHGTALDNEPACHCISIVQCSGTLPTFYQHGFTYGSAVDIINLKLSCATFHIQLSNIIYSKYFSTLFDVIDSFLWAIRLPFSCLLLALWLLSLLYLLHIMVIRLDLLHIKSHLHSPSSHRISAQSLLAAARVKALNKVLYLQP